MAEAAMSEEMRKESVKDDILREKEKNARHESTGWVNNWSNVACHSLNSCMPYLTSSKLGYVHRTYYCYV